MKACLIDTDILSYFLKGNSLVVQKFAEYLSDHDQIIISTITQYEILSGLKHRDSHNRMALFDQFLSKHNVLPLTADSITISADLYAQLAKAGTRVDDIDLLIAGVAMANDLLLVTHNLKHFGRIPHLTTEDWSQQ